ncbi:MAG: M56 family metallopeptidase [Thermoanaerobaculia bacterium]|nr:M56 family metallopeptidase [Thermoanaerobaculia bacterium]
MNLLDLSGFAGTLVRASLEGGVFALVVWALLALAPRVPAALRCWLWWSVCLKFLVGLAGLPVFELPVLPAPAPAAQVLPLAVAGSAWPGAVGGLPAAPPALSGSSSLLVLWLLGVAVALLLLVRDAARARRLLAGAHALEPSSLTQLFSELCQRFRLRPAPLLASPELVSPQVLGFASPRVLLPESSLLRLSTSELAMALAHELAHVVRGDLVLGWVPALCRRIFFFHPLAALAAREYALAREAACDAEVLRVLGSAPQSYGRFLLQWGVVPRETGLAAAAAAPSLRLLKRRLSMLEHTTPLSTTGRVAWWCAAAAVVAAGLIPLKLVAQSHRPPAPPPAPAVAPVAAPNPVPAPTPMTAPRAVAAPAPVPPIPPAPPAPPPPPPAKGSRSSYAYSTGGDDDGRSWVYLSDDNQTVMSGSYDEFKKVKKRFGGNGPIFYFSEGGKQYVIRDKALLAEIERLYEPVQKLGAQQGELGAKQGELGGKQGEIGAQQGALGAKQGALGARIGELAARQSRGGESADLEAEMEKLSAEMDRLSAEMDRLSEPMEALGREMEAYGEQMEALGEQMDAASEKAEREMSALVKRALAQGLAEEVK